MKIDMVKIGSATFMLYSLDETSDITIPVPMSGVYSITIVGIPTGHNCKVLKNGYPMFVSANASMQFICELSPEDKFSINTTPTDDKPLPSTCYSKELIDLLCSDILDLLREMPPKEQITNKHCSHNWKNYTGLNERYTYCTICEEKKL